MSACLDARERAYLLYRQAGDQLPFEDQSFDVVLSTFGCMFAPRHEVVADELARVLRPGGQIPKEDHDDRARLINASRRSGGGVHAL